MATTEGKVRHCFNCNAKFMDDNEFWDHIYTIDCSALQQDSIPATQSAVPQSEPPTETSEVVEPNPSGNQISPVTRPHVCGLCDLRFETSGELYDHTRSQSHREKVTLAASRYNNVANTKKGVTSKVTPAIQKTIFCEECQVPLPSIAARDTHIAGKKHQKVVANLNRSSTLQNTAQPSTVENPSETEHKNLTHVQPNADNTTNSILNESNFSSSHASRQDSSILSHGSDSKLDELNILLRRLCLTELLLLLHKLNNPDPTDKGLTTQVELSKQMVSGISANDLLELFRAICREELSRILPSNFNHS